MCYHNNFPIIFFSLSDSSHSNWFDFDDFGFTNIAKYFFSFRCARIFVLVISTSQADYPYFIEVLRRRETCNCWYCLPTNYPKN